MAWIITHTIITTIVFKYAISTASTSIKTTTCNIVISITIIVISPIFIATIQGTLGKSCSSCRDCSCWTRWSIQVVIFMIWIFAETIITTIICDQWNQATVTTIPSTFFNIVQVITVGVSKIFSQWAILKAKPLNAVFQKEFRKCNLLHSV